MAKVRIAIVGAPRAGKTTLAERLGRALELPVISSDDFISLGWSNASAVVARCIESGPGVYEGVAVVRALRKLLEGSTAKPIDQCIVLRAPREKLTRGQDRMRRGCETILREIAPELARRGVRLVYGIHS